MTFYSFTSSFMLLLLCLFRAPVQFERLYLVNEYVLCLVDMIETHNLILVG